MIRFTDLDSAQLEMLKMYTENIMRKHASYDVCRELGVSHPHYDLFFKDVEGYRVANRALEKAANRIWGIDLWALWCEAPDDFIAECEERASP